MQEERRLAAILALDVAGYSRLMARDEAGTLNHFKSLRSGVLEPAIARFNGRIVGSAGDSLLVEFASALNAVNCAVQMQDQLAAANGSLKEDERMSFRMGVNLGDIIAEAHTIYGDGVNLAARLEKLAEPGGICIGRSVYEQVRGKLSLTFADLGLQQFRNIPDAVQVYKVSSGTRARTALPLPDKPSIAVLPFQNMSGDAEQDYFADGMVEEIITALSRMRWLFVIARNSSFIYKGRAVDVKQVGRELGVRYVLEGSVRRAGTRLRIAGQLIDASTSAHLWADRFEGTLDDVFDLQDQVTASVVGAIAPKLEQAEIERAERKPTESLDAYDHYLRGMAGLHQWSRAGNAAALKHFYRAIELDPNFASAHGMAARAYVQRSSGGWIADRDHEITEATRLAHRAIELGHGDAVALCTAGFALADICGEIDMGDSCIDKALALNPNLAWGWLFSGWVKASKGEPELALRRLAQARRLSPYDPFDFSCQGAMAFAHFIAKRYAEGLSLAQAANLDRPDFLLNRLIAAACAAMEGRMSEAHKNMEHARKIDPKLTLKSAGLVQAVQGADFPRWLEGLRRAGLAD